MVQRSAISRRELLDRGARTAALGLVPWPLVRAIARATAPRIVIVGAGLAGLSCAYSLRRRGFDCALYEANAERIGGRCWTSRDWAEGQIAEHGGEFIDSRHRLMRGLAREFGLELVDLYAVANPGSPRLWLNGELRRRREMADARRVLIRALGRVARRVGSYTAADHNAAGVAFDALSVDDFLDETLPAGGADSPLGRYVAVEMASEFGLDADRLSALNLLYEYVENTPGAAERYHVRGGNDQIVDGLAARLPDGTVHLDAPLQSLARLGDASFSLRFGGIADAVSADRVVLALPFTTLREVDLSASGLSRRKLRCIDELGMGTNAKVAMQFERRPQAYGGWNGYMYNDDPMLLTWESTLGERGGQSIVTTYFGGRSGAGGLIADGAHAPTAAAEVERNLASLTQGGRTRLPGLAAGFSGRAFTDHWVADPWTRGSYAAFLPGQFTKYYGYAGRPEGAIHFAGEHTATANQGYLEGAVESGVRCAREISRAQRR